MTEEIKNEIKEEEKEIIEEGKSELESESKHKDNDVEEKEIEIETKHESDNDTGDTLTPSPEKSSESIDTNGRNQPTEDIKTVVQEKMLTQSQVNELVGKARKEGRESALRELLERYGVNSDSELDDVFGKGQTYDDLNDEFQTQGNSYKAALAENALLKSKIDPNRWEDVKLILGGKGLEVTAENIEAMIATHPEWRGATATEETATTVTPEMAEKMAKNSVHKSVETPATLRKLGNEPTPEVTSTEEEQVKKLFGF